jgi:hypothetical protein
MRAFAVGSIHSAGSSSLQQLSATARKLHASVGTHLHTGLACNSALQIHHGAADFVAHRGLALLHSGSSGCGACGAMACRVSRARSNSSASCGASMMAGGVAGTDFLLSRRCRVTSGDWVGRVLGSGCGGAVVALQASQERGLTGCGCVC